MKKVTCIIQDELGLHARPAGMLVKIVQRYNVRVLLCFGEKKVDACGIFAVLSLGAVRGDELIFEITGEDEATAAAAIAAFCKENL